MVKSLISSVVKSLLAAAFLLLVLSSLSAAEGTKEVIRNYKVSLNPMKMNQVADSFEVVKKLGAHTYEVYVKEQDVKYFLSLAPKAELLERDIKAAFSSDNKETQFNLSKYRTFADVERDLFAMAQNYKNIASLESYGVTKGGRKLYALKVTNPQISDPAKPELMVTAATHGDELITVEVLFSLMNELLAGHGVDSRLTKLIDGRVIYFIPVVSPDSFEARERYVQGLDPNRSFPWPQNSTNKTIDCIEALINFTKAHNLSGSLDLHAYGKLVMYPWGYTKNPPPAKDEVLMKDLTLSMVKENQYTQGQISTTIYVAKGSSADFFYWNKKTQAIAVELANQKVPPYGSIPKIVTEAREMMWTFLEHFN